MERRELLGILGAGTFALTTMVGRESTAQVASAKSDSVHKECLEACGECAKACDMAYHHCLTMVAAGKAEHAKPLQYMGDCSGFCGLSACNIARHSPLMAYSCAACADVCKATLAVVSQFDSVEMKAVAKELKRCEASCHAMLTEMGHPHH
jgi:hypothetical protein